MGHKINPLVFRLGSSNNWQYNLKEKKNWITNFLIYQLVSNQFLKYTIPHFNKTNKRNQRHNTGLVIMNGEKQLRSNNFIKRSMLFSHLLVGSLNSNLQISCYLYDYKINKKRSKVKKFSKYSQFFSNVYLRFRAYRLYFKKKKLKRFPRRLYKWLKKMAPNLWLFNFNLINVRKSIKIKINNLLILSKVWLRLFKKFNKLTKNQKSFYLNLFANLITLIIPMLNSFGFKFLSYRFYLILIKINLFNFHQKLLATRFFLELFRTRYFLYKAVSKSISQNLISMLPSTKGLTIVYHAIKERRMTASLLTNLILIKLGQYYRINSILYPLTNWIKRHRNVLGYRIIISGRLTRRERASHMIKSGRSMPLSSIKQQIDYHQDIKIMKFGMVGIKVYLLLKKKLRNSYYFFKFVI